MGGECTGKTTLAHSLASELEAEVVPEHLRAWVTEHGHAPLAQDQYAIWEAQRLAERGMATLGSIVSDPAAMMTGVYSRLYFEENSLLDEAMTDLPWYSLLVWCDRDITWVPDGAQRDGPEFRDAAHGIIEEFVIPQAERVNLPWLLASGTNDQRLEAILAELRRGTPH